MSLLWSFGDKAEEKADASAKGLRHPKKAKAKAERNRQLAISNRQLAKSDSHYLSNILKSNAPAFSEEHYVAKRNERLKERRGWGRIGNKQF